MPSFALPSHGSTPDALMALDSPKRSHHRIDDRDGHDEDDSGDVFNGRAGTPTPRMRKKSSVARPRSYHHILEDFQDHEQEPNSESWHPTMEAKSLAFHQEEADNGEAESVTAASPSQGLVSSQPSTPQKQEDTARRHKRFSLPAIALQTAPVTALPNATGEGRSKRFSLVLGGRSNVRQAQIEIETGGTGKGDLGRGVAAVKLGEILSRLGQRG